MNFFKRFENPYQDPYIIAEIGSNWHDEKDIFDSITAAKEAGASAVKLQYFSQDDLYGNGDGRESISLSQIDKIAFFTKALSGIDFMCSVFSPRGVKLIDPYVKMHKVASSNALDFTLLKAIRDTQKPVLISTGACDLQEIRQICGQMAYYRPGFALMYCQPAYPAFEHNLLKFHTIRQSSSNMNFKKKLIGFSDHSLDVYNSPCVARHFGARVFEKHFRLERITDTPDWAHSLTENQFSKMVKSLKFFPFKAETTEESIFKERFRARKREDGRFIRPLPQITASSQSSASVSSLERV